MLEPAYSYRPRLIVQEFPALEGPAKALGLLATESIDASIPILGLAKDLRAYFAEVVVEFKRPGETSPATVVSLERYSTSEAWGRSGVRFREGKVAIHVEAREGFVNGADLLREFGCMVEMVTSKLLSVIRDQAQITVRGRDAAGRPRELQFERRRTPAYILESAGFKFQDTERGYVNRHAAILHSLGLAFLTRSDPRLVFIDVLECAKDDPLMMKILTALAYRSSIDFSDRKELEQYANDYWRLSLEDDSYYSNIQQVNDLGTYYAGHLRDNVRNLAA